MKWYFLLLLFLIIPVSQAGKVPESTYKVYLDGEYLSHFNLTQIDCYPNKDLALREIITNFSYDPEHNCTWALSNYSWSCKLNPCTIPDWNSRYLLQTEGQSILTEQTTTGPQAQYKLLINSNGSIESIFVKEYQDYNILVLALIGLLIIPWFLLNIGLEIIIAYVYFKRKNVPYKKLWWVIVANILSFIIGVIFIGNTTQVIPKIMMIALNLILIIILELSAYKLAFKELSLKDILTLSLITNILTIFTSLLVMIWL